MTEHTTCADCGGSLTRAFGPTDRYVRCRRCGHVFPAAESFAHNADVARRRAADIGGGWPELVELAIAKMDEELVLSTIGTMVEIQTEETK